MDQRSGTENSALSGPVIRAKAKRTCEHFVQAFGGEGGSAANYIFFGAKKR